MPRGELRCPVCQEGPFDSINDLASHTQQEHGEEPQASHDDLEDDD